MSAYLANLSLVLATCAKMLVNFAPALAIYVAIAILVTRENSGTPRRQASGSRKGRNVDYSTTPTQLRQAAGFPFEDLEHLLEAPRRPSLDYRAELERGSHDISDWLSSQPQRIAGPHYPRVSRLRKALAARADQVTRQLGEPSWEQMLHDIQNERDPAIRTLTRLGFEDVGA